MNEKKIELEPGDVVYLKSDIRHKHPLTISSILPDEDIEDWEIKCVGITTGGKQEFFNFNNPNMLIKLEDIKK